MLLKVPLSLSLSFFLKGYDLSPLVKIRNRGTSSFFLPQSLQAIIPAAGGCLIFIDIGSGSGDVVVYSTVYCWWLFGTAESLVVRRRWTAACPPTLGRQQSLRLRMTARNQVPLFHSLDVCGPP